MQRIKDSGAQGVFAFLPSGPTTLGFVKAYNENGLKAGGIQLFAPGDLKDLMDQATLFDGIAAVRTGTAPLIADGAPPQQVKTAFVTPNIFDVLGVKVVRGRAFTPDDGRVQPPPPPSPDGGAPAGPPPERLPQIAVLSDGFWRRPYGADPSIVGRDIQVGFGPVHVVGVLAPGVELLFPPKSSVERLPDVWL